MSSKHTTAGQEFPAWLTEPLSHDVATSLRRLSEADDVQRIAVMPDVHLAGDVCVGLVLATSRLLYPAAVGSDIGCGMAAIGFDADADVFGNETAAATLLADLYRYVPANRHHRKTMPESLPDDLLARPLSCPRLEAEKQRDARVQFGSLGRGNHFLELQSDQSGRLWLMVHSGSRGIGQLVSSLHLNKCETQSNGLAFFDANSQAGADYINDMEWASRYAELNRLVMLKAASDILYNRFCVEADPQTLIQSNHNHVRREQHGGQQYLVHRKGAQSAHDGESGIVPGSMGTASFHVTGRGNAESLHSCSHGAGRRLSRTDAKKTVTARSLHQQMRSVWFDHNIASGLRDEAPSAYRDIHAVMRAQADLTRIERELRPILSYKGARR
jgi:tRNA-splicing ligase RtcB (3'-phosphate/5'-hydroxy nucleic acid ligase)